MEGVALFSTPVYMVQFTDVDDLCDEVTSILLAERERTPGLSVSNYGGTWHSVPDLALRRTGPWQQVGRRIVDAVREAFDRTSEGVGVETRAFDIDYAVQMWGMVMPPGGYVTVHEHHEASWSVAFYADAGDPQDAMGGGLTLVDPRRVPTECAGVPLFPSMFTVRPRTGMLVIFPGWLQHYVHPYTGTRPRVTISANIRLERTTRRA